MEGRVIIYFCKIHGMDQPIPRHHIASVVACHALRELDLRDLKDLLSNNEYSILINDGELIITDPEKIQRIACISPGEEVYLRLKLI